MDVGEEIGEEIEARAAGRGRERAHEELKGLDGALQRDKVVASSDGFQEDVPQRLKIRGGLVG